MGGDLRFLLIENLELLRAHSCKERAVVVSCAGADAPEQRKVATRQFFVHAAAEVAIMLGSSIIG